MTAGSPMNGHLTDLFNRDWPLVPVWSLMRVVKELGRPDLPLLSVYREYGVIPKESRDDNYNREGRDMALYQVARPGQVVMNKMKAWQGSIAVSDHLGLVSPDYQVLSFTRQGVEPRFYHYLLRSAPYIAEYARRAYGVRPAQWRLMFDDFRTVPLPVPSVSTQRAIANFLDRKTAAIDALIEKKERLVALLAEKRAALIHRGVTRGLDLDAPMKDSGVPWIGEIPAHWVVMRLKHLVSEAVAGPYGSSLTKAMYTDSGYRVYGQQQVIPDDFTIGDYYISNKKYQGMKRYTVHPGDVLISVMGTVGKVAVVPEDVEPGIINPRLVRYRPNTRVVTSRYLQLFIMSNAGQAPLLEAAQGSTMDGLNMRILGELQVALPPLAEQIAINRQARTIATHLDVVMARLRNQMEALREYRQSLITAAVTGQIDVRSDSMVGVPLDAAEEVNA